MGWNGVNSFGQVPTTNQGIKINEQYYDFPNESIHDPWEKVKGAIEQGIKS